MKVCTHCNKEKETSAFSLCKNGKAGIRSYCTDCQTEMQRQWRKNNPDKYIANNRATKHRMLSDHPEHNRAVQQVFSHRDILGEPVCIVCGTKAVAHHEDYEQPLKVVWLCQKHHMMRHRGRLELASP